MAPTAEVEDEELDEAVANFEDEGEDDEEDEETSVNGTASDAYARKEARLRKTANRKITEYEDKLKERLESFTKKINDGVQLRLDEYALAQEGAGAVANPEKVREAALNSIAAAEKRIADMRARLAALETEGEGETAEVEA